MPDLSRGTEGSDTSLMSNESTDPGHALARHFNDRLAIVERAVLGSDSAAANEAAFHDFLADTVEPYGVPETKSNDSSKK